MNCKVDLNEMKSADIGTCDIGSLVDISNISIDATKPVPQKLTDFVNAVGNPYLFKVNDIVVKVSFDSNGTNIHNAVASAVTD